jgi:glutathione S-transferase
MSTLKFYDLLSTHPKTWWSPNTYKTRLVLNYKQIPYTTIGVHYPDIAEVSQKLGLSANERWPQWTVPIIEHDGKVVRDSYAIAKYLDQQFPERPVLGEECEKWAEYIRKNLVLAVWPMTGPMVPTILDERDRKFFEVTRKLPERQETHEKVAEAMKPMIEGIKKGGYVYGGTVHYADFLLGSILIWILRTKESDFVKVMNLAGIEKWWEDISQYMESSRPRL